MKKLLLACILIANSALLIAQNNPGVSSSDVKYDKSYSYAKPENMTETIQAMKQLVLSQPQGVFKGNERRGSFEYTGTKGIYIVDAKTITVKFIETKDPSKPPVVRSSGSVFRFKIDKPQNLTQAVESVKNAIHSKKGSFEGNEKQGNFSASGISGEYSVADKIDINIIDKPMMIPNSLIEREVKNYFSGK